MRLKEARVVVAGTGGLGCSIALYLTAAGIGKLTLLDMDSVQESNLNRQILHWEEDIGRKKVVSAASKLAHVNPNITVIPLDIEITGENARDLIHGADLVMDGMDNFKTRLILNQACYQEGIPFIHGGIYGLMGEVTTIIPGKTPCLQCILPPAPANKGAFPVFGATPALVASVQVMEAVKLLAGFGSLLTGRMLYLNGDTMSFNMVKLRSNPDCPVCGGECRPD